MSPNPRATEIRGDEEREVVRYDTTTAPADLTTKVVITPAMHPDTLYRVS